MTIRNKILLVLACAGFVYGAAYVDLIFRARSAYLEGEKYLQWNREPALKKAYFDGELAKKEEKLKSEFTAGKFSREQLDARLELARFERDERISESSLKYAYVWFQTAVELFSPPESKWIALSRRRMSETKELWKKELDAKHIPYQDYMFE